MAGLVLLEVATLSRIDLWLWPIDLLEETVRVTLMRTSHQTSWIKQQALRKIELKARNVTECSSKYTPRVQRLDETGKTEGPSGLKFVIRVVTFPLPLRGREYWVAPLKRRSSQWPFTTAGFILRKRLPKGTVHLFGRYVQHVGRQLVAAYRNTRKKKNTRKW